MKLLIKIPTRGRGYEWLKSYIQNIEKPTLTDICLVLDNDIDNKISELNSIDFGGILVYTSVGIREGKIGSCNRYVGELDYDIILLASDDMQPQFYGFDEYIRKKFENAWNKLDSFFCFWDGAKETKNKLCTYPVLGVDYYKRFGYIYNPEYKSLYCDNEFTEVGKLLKRIEFDDTVILKHLHHAWGTRTKDALDTHNDTFYNEDRQTYQRRKKNHFDLVKALVNWCTIDITMDYKKNEYEDVKRWAILIPTLEDRKDLLNKIGTKLRNQIDSNGFEGIIDILTYCDNRQASVGNKRNELINRAVKQGFDYISFVDDDDMVSDDYIVSIYEKIKQGYDCISINGLYTTSTEKTNWIMKHNIKNENKEGKYFRMSNHLACWSLDIVKEKFKEVNVGEDSEWSARMQKHVKNPITIEKELYFYNFNPKNSVQTSKKSKTTDRNQRRNRR